tara:strand:+ start:43 stop:1227 length:1185 start_codon:yes stop_codon:yes gene_type:complete
MPFYKFGANDIIYNRIKAHPKCTFIIYGKKVHYNNNPHVDGHISQVNLRHVPTGNISLHEINVDRPTSDLVYPFLTKAGSLTSFRTISTTSFNTDFVYGDTITGSYPMSASISIDHYSDTISDSKLENGYLRPRLSALRNTIEHYSVWSNAYAQTEYYTNPTTLISIPSIFYGSSLKKGSVSLKFYITGTLAGELQDIGKNGELVQVSGSANDLAASYGSGSTAGIVLYNEGFIILTGSWSLDPSHVEKYSTSSTTSPKWIYFATTGSSATGDITGSAFDLSFEGTTYVPTATMFSHAPKGLLNHSNNDTYVKYGDLLTYATGNYGYVEQQRTIKNTVSASYSSDPTGSFSKQTWISKIGIYDDKKNLIAIAKLANPVKKTQEREFTFKLKLDF